MLLKYFYDQNLAHASYLVGCQKSGTACVVDPGRDIQRYLEAAEREGLKITSVAETHIHADYVSGARELSDRIGAMLYVSDEGPTEWKYQYLDGYPHQLVRDRDTFHVGNVRFDVLHTPGHTPESVSFLLTDEGGGAKTPMGIFTGDFIFVGSIGRPDLLEEAAGIADTAVPGARDLFQSVKRFRGLPDHLQVWPAHGAGSACGKGLGAIPSTTVGYEKLYNPALQFQDEGEFVDYILEDQPEAPKYFAVMKRVNKEGPKVLGADHHHSMLPFAEIDDALERGTVVDLRSSDEFAQGHVPGSLNIPLGMLASWAGWLLDYDRPAYVISDSDQLEEAARILHSIGCDNIAGGFDTTALRESGRATERYSSASPQEIHDTIESGQLYVVDVRSQEEWNQEHLAEAHHHFLGRLVESAEQIPADAKLLVHCQSGARSAIGASVLQAMGHKDVTNLAGGYSAWKQAQGSTVRQA